MPLKSIALASACALTLSVSVSAWAHHGHANYEDFAIEITGTVVEYEWVNPHTWVHVTVMGEGGELQEWALESGSIGQLARRGWAAESMKPGDALSALIRPLKNGSYGGVLGTIILSDGTLLCDPFGRRVVPDPRCRKAE